MDQRCGDLAGDIMSWMPYMPLTSMSTVSGGHWMPRFMLSSSSSSAAAAAAAEEEV